jgi:hypothetical protein
MQVVVVVVVVVAAKLSQLPLYYWILRMSQWNWI